MAPEWKGGPIVRSMCESETGPAFEAYATIASTAVTGIRRRENGCIMHIL